MTVLTSSSHRADQGLSQDHFGYLIPGTPHGSRIWRYGLVIILGVVPIFPICLLPRNRRPHLTNFLVRCKLSVAAFMASFGPFRLRFGVKVRVRVRVGVSGWVGSSPVP